jgi:hypothetical protein
LDLTRQVGIIECVRVPYALIGREFEIFTAEGLTIARGKIPEGHFELASGLRNEFMHGAGEAIRRQPFCKRISLKKGPIDLFRFCAENPMKTDGVGHLDPSWSFVFLKQSGRQPEI